MAYSVAVNWSEDQEQRPDLWDFTGAMLMRQKAEQELAAKCKHKKVRHISQDEGCQDCDIFPESVYENNMPMMNYAYPLETTPSNEKIIEVCENTNCTIVYNSDEDKHYLALTGGGMDLSQDIALAYIIVEKWIPYELCTNVCTQRGLSVSGERWAVLERGMIDSLKLYAGRAQQYLDQWGKLHEETMKQPTKRQRRAAKLQR